MPWQGDPNSSAQLALGVSRAVDCYLSIMLFHDRIDQREAQAGPLAGVLGGEEGFEQAVDDRLGNAAALILDDQVDSVLAGLAAYADGIARWRIVTRVG